MYSISYESAANLLNLSKDETQKLILSAPKKYKTYEINKRNGGKRTISQPSAKIKEIQRKLCKEIFKFPLKVHSAASAYQPRSKIVDAVKQHRYQNFLLKLDFKDFFPSFKPENLNAILEAGYKNRFTNEAAEIVKNTFFFYKKELGFHLSIGAPSSPIISNFLMYQFDEEVTKLCRKHQIKYTRYADDIAFSCNRKEALLEIKGQIPDVLEKFTETKNLVLNEKKQILVGRGENRHYLGIVLTDKNGISIGRNKKRLLRAKIYQYLNDNCIDESMRNYLAGYLGFCKQVDRNILSELKKKFGYSTIDSLVKAQIPSAIARNLKNTASF